MTRGGKSAPGSQMSTADDHFEDDCVCTRVPPLHIDMQIGHGQQHVSVELANLLAARVMRIPWLVVVACRCSERAHYAVKVMLVFQADVLFDDPQSRGYRLLGARDCHP